MYCSGKSDNSSLIILVAHKYDKNHESRKASGKHCLWKVKRASWEACENDRLMPNRCLGSEGVTWKRPKGSERQVGGLPRINLTHSLDLTPVLRKDHSLPEVEWMLAFITYHRKRLRRLWGSFSTQIYFISLKVYIIILSNPLSIKLTCVYKFLLSCKYSRENCQSFAIQ